MHADAEGGESACDVHAVVERNTVRERRGTGDDAGAVRFGDAAINARGPAQIIGIDDEILHSTCRCTCTAAARLPVLSDSYLVASGSQFVPLTDTHTNSSMATSTKKLRQRCRLK